jgi:histidinol-phosphate aminotransferase
MLNLELSRRKWMGLSGLGIIGGAALSSWDQEVLAVESLQTKQASDVLPIRILYNENPLGCSQLARQAAIESLSQANFYAYELAGELSDKLKALHNISNDQGSDHTISLSCGSSELLLTAALAHTQQSGNVVVAAPSYESIMNTSRSRHGPTIDIKSIPLLSDGSIDIEQMMDATNADTKIIVVTNPNNPTGNAIDAAPIIDLIRKAPKTALIVVDEAYIDYLDDADSQSVIGESLLHDNVLVTRTFSKIHGLAGMRIGYAVGHRSIFERMQVFRTGSMALNVCGLAAAIASLDDKEFQKQSREMAKSSRTLISKALLDHDFEVVRSDAACIWADWGKDTSQLIDKLAAQGVLIASGKRWSRPNCIRVSVGTSDQTAIVIEKLAEVIAS